MIPTSFVIASIFCVQNLGNNSDWNDYVIRMTDRWKRHVCGWLINGRNNLLCIIKYEDLKDNIITEMLRLTEFFGGVKMPNASRINIGYNKFYRNHSDVFCHYTSNQERYISETVQDTIKILRRHDYDDNSHIITILNSYVLRNVGC